MKRLRFFLQGGITLAVAFVGGAGCTQSLGDFTVLASKNVDLSNFNSQAAENAQKVTGKDEKAIIFIFPTGIPNLKEAVDRAEEQGNACALTNARIEMFSWYIPYIVGDSGFIVTGNPVPR